jgi:hypothetical protein
VTRSPSCVPGQKRASFETKSLQNRAVLLTFAGLFAGCRGTRSEGIWFRVHLFPRSALRIGSYGEAEMIAKPIIIAACAAIILSFGTANAGPCDADQTTGQSRVNRAAQERQQQERAQGFPEQAKVGGTTVVPLGFSETDTDRLATMPPQGQTPAKIETDRGC